MNERLIIWIVFAALAVERFIETVLPDKKRQKGRITSKWLFYCIIGSGSLIYVVAAVEFAFLVKSVDLTISAIGAVLILLRIGLKIWALRTLDRFWSINIEIRDDHRLMTSGPYRFVRHPSYLSTMTEAVAGPLILNAYFTIIYAVFFYFPFIFIRIYLEEKELATKFGREYEEYRKRVPLLLPLKFGRK